MISGEKFSAERKFLYTQWLLPSPVHDLIVNFYWKGAISIAVNDFVFLYFAGVMPSGGPPSNHVQHECV